MAKSARPLKPRPRRGARINIRLQEELRVRLWALAQADGRSLSSYIERILERHAAETKAR
jgi:predicted HicB family RNase H-like nuclease